MSTNPLDADGKHVKLAAFYRDTLLNDVVPFWFPRSVDTEHGGFLHCLDRDGSVVDTDKSVWAQGRMSWMLLTLHNTVERRAEWLAWAESGLNFLEKHCFDADGRMFFHVTREGRPIRKRRYAYSEAFAAIAYAAHARATGNARSVERARELFDFFTRWNFTPGLMPPKFTDARPMIGLGPRMMTLATAQELRANLGDDPQLTSWMDRCLDEIARLFVKPDLQCVMENVAPDGSIVDHFDGRTLNPGHAIEAAWFILHEGAHRKDDALIKLGCQMLDWMWRRGWDEEHGGLFCFRDVHGRPVQEYWHDMKFWWPHDEALIATLLAWKLTGEARYAEWHEQVRAWSFKHFADPQHGEWFGYLHRDGSVSNTLKGGLWKSFFHHPRALWYCGRLLETRM
ncbi:MAG: AGE family epimerase/isomerase [Verrucomicrobia bacterium]|nr:AGE family epimerase/isomerase [Verrucomicrobiota bacterium]